MASAFVGSSFGTSSNTIQQTLNTDNDVPAGLTYGGQVAYLWHGVVGGEFIADFAPDVGFDSILFASQPHMKSYMGNVIAGLPFGGDRFNTYVSGGFGTVGISADLSTRPDINGNRSTVSTDRSRWGSNIGFGMLAFAEQRWGVRGDVRYFRASSNDEFEAGITPQDRVTQSLISDLHFWRGSLGLAYRWS